jgi:hypothetical protein
MVPGGTLRYIKEFFQELDLDEICKTTPTDFSHVLDQQTTRLLDVMPVQAKRWGVARKCLTLFFRDSLYNFYLRRAFDLAKFEAELEIPLDGKVGTALANKDCNLPRWNKVKVKTLTPEISARGFK